MFPSFATSTLLCAAFVLTIAFPASSMSVNLDIKSGAYKEALIWLQQFKYYDGKVDVALTEDQAEILIKEPLKKFKQFYKVRDQSDKLDDETLRIMHSPRCNEKDDDGEKGSRRRKRYSFLNDALYLWKDPRTPYPIKLGFRNYLDISSGITRTQQENAFMECAKRFSEAADLVFKLVDTNRDTANIEIEFVNIDGPYNTIGTGLSPVPFANPPTSYLKLDWGEPWTIGVDPRGINLVAGICHEMGHTLSMGHSHSPQAIMYPSIQIENMSGELNGDDVAGIQTLYGLPKTNTVSSSVSEESSVKEPSTEESMSEETLTEKAPVNKPTVKEPTKAARRQRVRLTNKTPVKTPEIIAGTPTKCTKKDARKGLCTRTRRRSRRTRNRTSVKNRIAAREGN